MLGVLLALTSNTVSKAVFASGSRAFTRWVQLGLLLTLLGAWAGLFMTARS